MPVIVVLDTNILTVPAQFSVDIFAESERVVERRIEFVVLKSVIQELEGKLVAVFTPQVARSPEEPFQRHHGQPGFHPPE